MDDSHPAQTLDLSEARAAYEMALQRLEDALPHTQPAPVIVDPTGVTWRQVWGRAVLLVPYLVGRGIVRLANGLRDGLRDTAQHVKERLVQAGQPQPAILGGPRLEAREQIRQLLLEVLWARDHVQDAIEHQNGAPYAVKRDALAFVMSNEARLQRLGQFALQTADLDTGDLRDAHPVPPSGDRWWWFLNLPRARLARRMNLVWFLLAMVPALASIVLITLLAQRLAINGPDLLSGASVVAQVGLGLGSILAGRELLQDLLLKGSRVSWEGQITFALASLFLVVVVIFYFLAPPGAAMVYNIFGQQAINSGNAAEAELYLESAARLDPDPHAAALLEVGCLYQTLGAPDRAQTVFERVLEADSRLLLARYHLAGLYNDRGETDQALQLLEDGLNLLEAAREDMQNGDYDFLPNVRTEAETDQLEYLLRLARGRAYLESGAPEQAKGNLRDAEALFNQIAAGANGSAGTRGAAVPRDRLDLSCGPDDDLQPYILSTQLTLHYYLALMYDALCDDPATIQAAIEEWRYVRNGQPSSSRQEAWRDDAVLRLSSGTTCENNYNLGSNPGLSRLPARR